MYKKFNQYYKNGKFNYLLLFLMLFLLPCSLLASVHYGGSGGAGIADVLDHLLSLMTGKIARVFAVITIVVCGYLTYLGKLTTRAAINVALGIGIIFGARQLGDFLMGGL